MPRDLEAERQKLSSPSDDSPAATGAILKDMPPLSKRSDEDSEGDEWVDEESTRLIETLVGSSLQRKTPDMHLPTSFLETRFEKLKDLYPYCLLLNQDDVDQCDWLEHVTFDANEAASREKLEYRLTVCGELCSGIFTSVTPTSTSPALNLLSSHPFPHIGTSDRSQVLLGHIIATKSHSPLVTDSAMGFPKDWRTNFQYVPSSGTGHNEEGKTVCLHSLCVHPDFHNRGLGRCLLVSWTQRIREAGGVERIALICRERYLKFYEGVGFKKIGESRCQYGGGGWYDMVMDFSESRAPDDF